MIENIIKIKGMEFNFPIDSADKAVYKVESVHELSTNNSTNGKWGAVVLASFTNNETYIVPEHVVFTIEYDTVIFPTYIITAVTSDSNQAKIEVGKGAVKTPEKFFECLKELAEVITKTI